MSRLRAKFRSFVSKLPFAEALGVAFVELAIGLSILLAVLFGVLVLFVPLQFQDTANIKENTLSETAILAVPTICVIEDGIYIFEADISDIERELRNVVAMLDSEAPEAGWAAMFFKATVGSNCSVGGDVVLDEGYAFREDYDSAPAVGVIPTDSAKALATLGGVMARAKTLIEQFYVQVECNGFSDKFYYAIAGYDDDQPLHPADLEWPGGTVIANEASCSERPTDPLYYY